MMLRSPVLRASRVLTQTIKYTSSDSHGHGLEAAYLDPYKHFAMNKAPHWFYIDYWPIGQYPELHLVGSVPPTTYQPRVENILAKTLASKFNTNIALQDLKNSNWRNLIRSIKNGQRTVEDFQNTLLKDLAEGIFIRESRWTWPVEQEERLSYTIDSINFNEIDSVEQFLSQYNEAIETLVSFSHFGLSPQIPQPFTAQEKHLFDELRDQPTGIPDLEQERAENTNVLNKLFKVLHKI